MCLTRKLKNKQILSSKDVNNNVLKYLLSLREHIISLKKYISFKDPLILFLIKRSAFDSAKEENGIK